RKSSTFPESRKTINRKNSKEYVARPRGQRLVSSTVLAHKNWRNRLRLTLTQRGCTFRTFSHCTQGSNGLSMPCKQRHLADRGTTSSTNLAGFTGANPVTNTSWLIISSKELVPT